MRRSYGTLISAVSTGYALSFSSCSEAFLTYTAMHWNRPDQALETCKYAGPESPNRSPGSSVERSGGCEAESICGRVDVLSCGVLYAYLVGLGIGVEVIYTSKALEAFLHCISKLMVFFFFFFHMYSVDFSREAVVALNGIMCKSPLPLRLFESAVLHHQSSLHL